MTLLFATEEQPYCKSRVKYDQNAYSGSSCFSSEFVWRFYNFQANLFQQTMKLIGPFSGDSVEYIFDIYDSENDCGSATVVDIDGISKVNLDIASDEYNITGTIQD